MRFIFLFFFYFFDSNLKVLHCSFEHTIFAGADYFPFADLSFRFKIKKKKKTFVYISESLKAEPRMQNRILFILCVAKRKRNKPNK